MSLQKTAALLLAATALGWASSASAQYPERPVTLVVPYSAGGVTDIMARVLADQLSQSMGQPFVVENRPGAGGAVGMEAVLNGEHDGYTLVMVPANIAVMTALYPSLSFDPVADFAPVANIGASAIGIATHKSLPVETFEELIAYVKDNPDLSYTSCGNASPQHIAGEYLQEVAGIEMTHINYPGCGDSIPDVLAGRVPLLFASVPHLIPHYGGNDLNVLAVSSGERSVFLPEVPTVAESGYPEFVIDAWFGVVAPGNTPSEIIEALNTAMNEQLGSDAMKERMAQQSVVAVGGTAESFGETIRRDEEQLGGIIRNSGIMPN